MMMIEMMIMKVVVMRKDVDEIKEKIRRAKDDSPHNRRHVCQPCYLAVLLQYVSDHVGLHNEEAYVLRSLWKCNKHRVSITIT